MKKSAMLIFVFILLGCANTRLQTFYKSLDNSLNKKTYDQAIMTWGQPVSVTQGDEIFVATWASSTSGSVAMPLGNMTYVAPVSSGFNLQLTFDKRTRSLKYWRYQEW